MLRSINLQTTLENALATFEESNTATLYLGFDTDKGEWILYNGLNVDDVWQVHHIPSAVSVLKLERDSVKEAMLADPFTDLERVVKRFALMTVTRPAYIGLHDFLIGPADPTKPPPADDTPGEVQP